MSKLTQLSLLALAVAVTTASTPFVPPVQPVITLAPVAIIEGGTVSTLPKSVKTRGGKVVVLRGKGAKAAAKHARKSTAPAVTARVREKAAPREATMATGGSSAPDVMEMRNSESALRVMIIGPDGLTRTRYIPAAPTLTARTHDD